MDTRDEKTLKRISRLAFDTLASVRAGRNPSIDIPVRALSNVFFDEKKRVIQLGENKQQRLFFHYKQAKVFMQTMLVAQECKKLIEQGATTSIRDLFYAAKHTISGTKENTFDEQDESDPVIEDLEVSLDVLREELHLRADNRGAMVGAMTIVDSGDTIDLRRMGSGGWSVPSIVEPNRIEFREHECEFILFVEKGAVWSRLNEDKFWKTHKCVIVSGGGMAARGTRRLLQRLVNELKLPLYCVVDNDPWGFYIYSVIKQGSINLAYESMRLAVPKARFLGLSSKDADEYKYTSMAIDLNDEDRSRIAQIKNYPWFQDKRWQGELETMLQSGRKYEIEALSHRGIRFVTEEYIPQKIKNRKWIE